MTPRGEKIPAAILGAYYATLAAFFVASFFPEYRVWGINWWAYFPLWVKFLLLGIGVSAPTGIDRVIDCTLKSRDDISPTSYRWLVGGFLVLMLALFYLLRARTHFLGDGYTLLHLLGSENPFIKPRNFGGTIVQFWILKWLGGTSEADALLPYQIVSYTAGLLFLSINLWLSHRLFTNLLSRFLFLAVTSTTGFVLLFFGYVENYSLFVVTVYLHAAITLLIVHRQASRWWILPAQGSAIFFHIFGVVLLPATAVALLVHSPLWRFLVSLRLAVRSTLLAVILLAGTGGFFYWIRENLFVRLSILPLVTDKFTVGGYTLFSFPHLADIFNLTILLFPGIAVAALALWQLRSSRIPEGGQSQWSLAFTLSIAGCLGAAFIFSPGLGMPRDWDLFALAGVPLILFLCHRLLSGYSLWRFKVAMATALLGALILFPRAVVFSGHEIALKHIEAYAGLDLEKSGSLRFLLAKYYREHDRLADVRRVDSIGLAADPDTYRMNEAIERREAGDTIDMIPILRRTTQRNPLNWAAWGNIGVIALFNRSFDSAYYYLRISDALNPHNASTNLNLASCLYHLKRYDEAEERIAEAIRLDSTQQTTELMTLQCDIYRESNQQAKYVAMFAAIASKPDAPEKYVRGWIELLLAQKRFAEVEIVLSNPSARNLDPLFLSELRYRYPNLAMPADRR